MWSVRLWSYAAAAHCQLGTQNAHYALYPTCTYANQKNLSSQSADPCESSLRLSSVASFTSLKNATFSIFAIILIVKWGLNEVKLLPNHFLLAKQREFPCAAQRNVFFQQIRTEFDHFKAVGTRGARAGLNENPVLLLNNRNQMVEGVWGFFLFVFFWFF